MACESCKKSKKEIRYETILNDTNRKNSLTKIKEYFFKSIVFLLLSAIILPIILPITLIVLFRLVVLSKGINILPLIYYIGKKLFKDNEEEDDDDEDEDDDYDNLNEDEYELMDPNEVVVLK